MKIISWCLLNIYTFNICKFLKGEIKAATIGLEMLILIKKQDLQYIHTMKEDNRCIILVNYINCGFSQNNFSGNQFFIKVIKHLAFRMDSANSKGRITEEDMPRQITLSYEWKNV